MPRGKYVNHKGRNRHFTSPEELEEERKNDEKKKWRNTRDESSDEEEDDDEKDSEEGSGSDSEEDSEDEGKGASSLIEIQNPNRQPKKAFQKASTVEAEVAEAPQLSRREREQLEKQRAQAAYQKAHAEGKTAQAKADLARLAIIKQHRAEAAARREAEKKTAAPGKK
uniref:Putative 28 kDa heat-and acid-stable phosphoprotein n=1 Tax=Psorophora albipes TaxID=869069 RepID=T1D539_9DIPT